MNAQKRESPGTTFHLLHNLLPAHKDRNIHLCSANTERYSFLKTMSRQCVELHREKHQVDIEVSLLSFLLNALMFGKIITHSLPKVDYPRVQSRKTEIAPNPTTYNHSPIFFLPRTILSHLLMELCCTHTSSFSCDPKSRAGLRSQSWSPTGK